MKTRTTLNPYQYSSVPEFLQDAYARRHSEDESFSYDRIATLCGLKSRTEARNLIKGVKKATDSQLTSLAECFGLDASESKYLVCLARFAEAGGSPTAFDLFQKLVAMQAANSPAASPFREIEVATSVLHMTILTVLELPNAPQSAAEIASAMKDRFSVREVETAMGELLEHKYAHRTQDGRLVPSQKHFHKYDYQSNFFLKRFHQQSLEISRSALENEPTSERYLVGTNFVINSKVFPRIVQKMNAFAENLMALEGVAGEADTVVQLNQQLIKMTKTESVSEPGLRREPAERVFATQPNEGIVRTE